MIAVCIFFIFCRYVLRDTQEECLAMPLTHAKASGHSLHTIDYTIILYIVWSIIVCCMYIGWYIEKGKAGTLALSAVVCVYVDIQRREREAVWHCLQGKGIRALCLPLEGKGEGLWVSREPFKITEMDTNDKEVKYTNIEVRHYHTKFTQCTNNKKHVFWEMPLKI